MKNGGKIRGSVPWEGMLALLCVGLIFLVYFKNFVTFEAFAVAKTDLIVHYVVFPLSLILLGIGLSRYGIGKYWDIRIVMIFFVWFVIGVIANTELDSVRYNANYYVLFISVIVPGVLLPYLIPGRKRMMALRIIGIVYFCILALISIIGVYVAFRGIFIQKFFIGMQCNGRLFFILEPNHVATMTLMAFGIGLMLLCGKRSLPIVISVSVMLLVFCIVFSLTDSRAVKVGALPMLFVFGYLQSAKMFKRTKRKICLSLFRIIAGIAACAIFWLLLQGISVLIIRTGLVYIPVPETGSVTQQVEGGVLSNRDVVESIAQEGFSNRMPIWTHAIRSFLSNRKAMLFGASPALSYDLFLTSEMPHYHNAYLAILTAFGIPGFILFLVYCSLFGINALKMFFSKKGNYTQEERFVPSIALTIFVICIVEETVLTLGYCLPVNIWLPILCSYTFVLSRSVSDT